VSAQLGLDWNRSEQTAQLERVSSKIALSVLEFCRNHFYFRMEALTAWVRDQTGVAPDSPGRILRDLRQRGLIGYEVVNRRQSLYRVIWCKP
jgi:hypothetical protein